MSNAGTRPVRQTVRELRPFLPIWAGQLVSALGSGLTSFAVAVVVYQRTGSAAQFGLLMFAWMFPALLLSPVAGTLVDRWDRRRVLVAADTGAALMTLATAALVLAGHFEVWYLFATSALGSAIASFQEPALTAAVSAIVPRDQYGRALGLLQLMQPVGMVVAPLLAGALVVTIGLGGIMVIDAATYLAGIAGALAVSIPSPPRAVAAAEGGRAWLAAARRFKDEAAVGWRFVRERPGLRGLLMFVAVVNFWAGFISPLLAPMVLSTGSPAQLATVQASFGAGAIAGGVILGAWGGPRRRIAGLLGAMVVLGLALSALGLSRSVAGMAGAFFVVSFASPMLSITSSAIWMSKTPQEVMGRVAAVRRVFMLSLIPLASLVAGPLADRVFSPAMMPGGALAGVAGPLVGVGRGRGVALMFVLLGLLLGLTAVVAWLVPVVRNVERDVPDAPHPQAPPQAVPTPSAAPETAAAD
jgi:MFS family permease